MAVVRKTSETRNRNLAKATIRYIMHRRELGERISRPLFSGEAGDSQKLAAYEAIDHAPPSSLSELSCQPEGLEVPVWRA
jgi:hypothetical protein